MKKLLCSLTIAALLSASIALAADPTPGIYNSVDIGGTMLTGRGTNSWTAPLNGADGLGDVFNSVSWDGALLGTQWRFQCGVSPAVQTRVDNRVNGTGTVVFTTNYTGGTFWLSRFGPWGDGVNDLTGTITTTQSIVTLQYVNFVPVQSRLNVNTYGEFDDSNCILTFAISNGIGAGDTDLGPKPAGFPDFLDANCGATRIYGSWGHLVDITMMLECPVPLTPTTWSAVKTLYR